MESTRSLEESQIYQINKCIEKNAVDIIKQINNYGTDYIRHSYQTTYS